MGEFLSGLGSGLKSNFTPTKGALSRKVDAQRNQFLKGVSNSRHGKKEDPTYLHFKFIFDFAISSQMDPETFLAPSPLFRDSDPDDEKLQKYVQDVSESRKTAGSELSLRETDKMKERSGFSSDIDFFYGAKFRVPGLIGNGAFPMHSPISYLGAQDFLGVRSDQRKYMIRAFKRALDFINRRCPHYFQSVTGLDSLLKSPIGNFHKQANSLKRAGTLTIDCLESIDMRISAMAELYRKAIYDYTNHRVMLPENLRKFRMWMVVTEIRNIQLKQGGIDDLLNPFSIPSVAQGANFLENFNSQTGLLKEMFESDDASDRPGAADFGSYDMMPYAWVYQFDKCEFDFDETYPFGSSIDNKGGSAVSTKFSIHVGKVKDYKIQFNQLADLIGKDDGISKMVINDTWNPKAESYKSMDYSETAGIENATFSDKPNPGQYAAELGSKFIMNSVADLKNVGVSILQSKLLGNIYGLGGIDPGNALGSVQSIINQAKEGIPNPFAKNDPQSKGLGGPGERQYPIVKEDAYPGNGGANPQGSLGNALPSSSAQTSSLNEDSYKEVPGTDLGLPNRQYPKLQDDEYKDVPGNDLGVPGRTYGAPNGKVYTPDPNPYNGVSDKEYTDPTPPTPPNPDSVYKKDPVVYPDVKDDQYKDVPGQDLGVPNRSYQDIKSSEDVYKGAGDLGVPDRKYPDVKSKEYAPLQNPNPTNYIGDQYKNVPGSDLGLPSRSYPSNAGVADEYPNVPGTDLGVPKRIYPDANGDTYKESPGSDLGLPVRVYPNIGSGSDEYPNVPGSDLGVAKRAYPPSDGDAYKESPGSDLGLPKRIYPNTKGLDEYPNV